MLCMRGMQVVDECVRRLARYEYDANEDGEREAARATVEVVRLLRSRYATAQSLATKMCCVRRAYNGPLDARGREVEEMLRALAASRDEHALVDAVVASYGRMAAAEDTPLHDAVRKHAHELLPRHVRRVCLTEAEKQLIKQQKRERTVAKHKHAPRVDGNGVLRHATSVVRNASRHGLYDLSLALLLVTGRRTCELLNGRSSFVCASEGISDDDGVQLVAPEYTLQFTGQLKVRKGMRGEARYAIPTLMPALDVLSAIDVLRAKQKTTSDDVRRITNAAVSRKYQSGLGQRLRSNTEFASVRCVHALRGVYASIAYRMHDWKAWTLPAVVMRILGHVSAEESLAYTAMHVSYSNPCA